MSDALRLQLLGNSGLGQAAMAKAQRAAQLEAMLGGSQGGEQAQQPPGAAGQMSQSQFLKARSPQERAMQQQALIQKLRSMGQ